MFLTCALTISAHEGDHNLPLDRERVVVVGDEVQPLIAGVLEALDGVGQQPHASEEPRRGGRVAWGVLTANATDATATAYYECCCCYC